MADEYSKSQFWKWRADDEQWNPFLADLRTKIAMTQRQVTTKTARAKELMTSGNRDALATQMAMLEDLADLEATVTDAFTQAHKDEASEEIAKAESEASKKFAASTEAIIKAATKVVKSVSDRLEEKMERETRRERRNWSQEGLDGQHHNDPPNKISVASDLKPEKLCDSVNQLELDDWIDRAETYAEASNLLTQTNTIQLGYLQALVKPEMWQLFREYGEANMILPSEIDFARGLEILKETYYKKNDMYTLKLKTSADTFKGRSYADLQSWFFKFRQKARNCGLSTMSEDEMLCFRLITAMTAQMQQTMFVQNPRPTLQEVLDFVDNQVMVENMTAKASSKKSDTVHSIEESEKSKAINCWICHGNHRRDMCTADKNSLRCGKCGITGHVTEACRGGRRQARTPSRSSAWSGRSPSSSSESSSSAEERRRKKKKKKKKEKRESREKTRNKSNSRQRASSAATSSGASRSTSRGKHNAGRTPKIKKKIRDTVNNLEECDFSENGPRMKGARMIEVSQQDKREDIYTTLDTGSKYNIVDESEANFRSWHTSKITEWEMPSLKGPDGNKLVITGKATLWLRLAKEKHKRKLEFYVTPCLASKLLVGLIDLKRLHWISPRWPMDIEQWSPMFEEADKEDVVNNVDNTSSSEDEESEEPSSDEEEKPEEPKEPEKEKEPKEPEAKEEDEAEDGTEEGIVDITDFTDLKTYRDIPNFSKLPTWLQEMITEHQTVFTNQLSSKSIMNVEPVTFSLRDNIRIPDKNITAHLPPANLRASADRLLDKLESGGLIKKAPRLCKYKSKAFFKPKKNQEARLLIDYKASQVNQLIERPTHPQYGVEQLTQQVKPGMNYFISADLTGAYFCYPLAEGPSGGDLTCFLTHRGKYVFSVLPMGCTASQDYLGGTLTELLDQDDLKDDENKGVIRIVDDIAGFTRDEITMKKMAKALFKRCEEFNVKLNPTKFQFSTERINFAGVVISKEGVEPDPERMSGLARYPTPTSAKDVKAFLGCATSLAAFTSVLLQDCKALRALTKKGAAFHWGAEEENEMKRIIKRLTDPTILHHYDTAQPLAIDVDSSIQGVGYTAYMFDPSKGMPGPNNAKLVKCGSAASKQSWANYSPIELEASGTLLAVRKLDHYLINNKQVVVRNDHLPFVQAYNTKDISQVSPRLRRIFLELAELDIKLTWAEASSMLHVDAMSRHPVDPAEDLGPDPIDDQHQRLNENIVNNIEEENNDEDIIDFQVDDPLYSGLFHAAQSCQGYQDAIRQRQEGEKIDWKEIPTGSYIRQLKEAWPNLHVAENSRNEKIFIYEGNKFLVPPGAIKEVLDAVDTTHMGYPKAIGYAKARYFWPKMAQSIEAHCNACLICIQHSQAKPEEAIMPTAPASTPSSPFEVIYCDEFSFEHKDYLMIVDGYSNYSKAIHLPGRRTASVLIKHLLQWQMDHGFARVIGTDGAKVFTGEEFQAFLEENKIQHRLSAPMKSSSNGRVEERIKAYKNMLTKLQYEGRKNEAEARATWELLQNMPSKPGQFSPARLAFRRERRHPLMPCLPAEGGEIEKGREQMEEKDREQVRRNSKKGKHVKKPDKFIVGQRVLTQKYTSGNAKRDRDFTIPAKVLAIRPNTHERSAILELSDGKTTIRDRIHCCLDPTQPQPDTISNIEECASSYLKLISKSQVTSEDDQQAIDSMMQKLKAKGQEVQFVSNLGMSILVQVTPHLKLHSCLQKPGSHSAKKVKFKLQEREE